MKEIPLSKGKVALVDDDLFERLNVFKWSAVKDHKTWYARRRIYLPDGRPTNKLMHREIFELLGLPVPQQIDHRDLNGLNNQRDNLRPATRSEQARNHGRMTTNTSGFIGVSWNQGKWHAHVRLDRKRTNLGRFETALEAALARDEFAKLHHGEFAVTNEDVYLPDAL